MKFNRESESTMRIREIRLGQTGTADVLRIHEADVSEQLNAGEVRIRVHYSGINFADVHMRVGLYVGTPKRPFVPGFEISGIVEAIGSGVTSIHVGDAVIAGTLYGGYRSHVVIPAWQAIPLPKHLSLQDGAALPVAFVTAYVALHEMGRIRKSDRIMIDCATGGVGTIALQMARDVGCETIGLSGSPGKFSYVEKLGGKPMLRSEYENNDKVGGFDFILNSSGGKSLLRDHARLRSTGRLVSIGASSLLKNGRPHAPSIAGFLYHSFRPLALQSLFDDSKGFFGLSVNKLFTEENLTKTFIPAIATTKVVPFVGQTFEAHHVADAHRHLESGAAKGKVLLQWQ